MPFTISPSAYRGGEMWYDALTNAGKSISNSIGQAMQFYQQRHQALTQSDALMEQLSQTQDATGKPILDRKAYERYLAHSDKERASIGEGYKNALLFGHEVNKFGVEMDKVKAETDLYKARKEALDEANVPPDEGSTERIGPYGNVERWSPKQRTWIPMAETAVQKERAALSDPISVTKGTMSGGAFQPHKPGKKGAKDFVQVIGADGVTRTYPTSRWREIKAKMRQGGGGDMNPTPQGSVRSRGPEKGSGAASRFKVGDTVRLKDNSVVKIKKINPDGTFEY